MRNYRVFILVFGLLAVTCASLSPLYAMQEPVENDRFSEAIDLILEEIVDIRGLSLLHPVAHGTSTREQIRDLLIRRIEMEYPREEIVAEERSLKRLNLIPEELDLYEFMIELLTEQIAGYYDPLEEKFLLAEWVSAEGQEEVIAHELTHALQDQHFDLEAILNADVNGDRALAYSSVVEGDGILTMLAYLLSAQGRTIADLPDLATLVDAPSNFSGSEFKMLATAPLFLRETLLFPYSYGARFVQTVLRESGWEGLNAVYSDLPHSTEQILHPEKYLLEKDAPRAIEVSAFSDTFGEGWSSVTHDTLGELGIAILLKERNVDEELALEAARGWGGDSYFLLEGPEGEEAVFLVSVWDSPREAREFFETYSRHIDGKILVDSTGHKLWDDASGRTGIRHQNDKVEITMVPPGTDLEIFEASSP